MTIRAHELRGLGQSVWLDYIHRQELASGVFAAQIRDQGVVGVTSNPTIFQQALAAEGIYDASIERHLAAGLSGPGLFERLEIEDIQTACDLLAAVHEESGGLDGRVSIEVSPRLAHDTAGTLEEARRLHRSVARPNVMIKVPATAAGLPAITTLTAEGVCVNVTLIFSLARYAQVMEAWLAGLEQRAGRGLPLDRIFSVASFFVSRVDTKLDKAIDGALASMPAGDPRRAELEGAKGRAAIANARLAYQRFLAFMAAPRAQAVKARGAPAQRPLWASTSTKNPAFPDTLYVDELIGADTVNTMPPQTLKAFNDHGTVRATIGRDLEGAHRLFERLPMLGVPIESLIAELEGEGVVAFAKSYDALLATLESRRQSLAGRTR
jgi:transaldolase